MIMKRKWQRMVLLERAPDPVGELPKVGFVRLEQIIGDSKADPPIAPLVPVSKSAWWAGIRSGRFPPGVKILPGVTAWNWRDIHQLLENLQAEQEWTPQNVRRARNRDGSSARL
jgi:predicted DNA-binding transcriptional regulator AlpA